MKKVSKVLAFILGGAMACLSFGSINVSAESLGDLNDDGIINMMDVTILQGYLCGTCDIVHHGAADVDDDGVITMADLSKFMKYMSGTVHFTGDPSCIHVPSLDENRLYIKHSYKTNSNLIYQLNSNQNMLYLEDAIMPYADNLDNRVRTTDTAVVQIPSPGGTGFIIDDHIIVTAAHCVYNADTNLFNDNTTVVVRGKPYSNISQELDRFEAVEVHIPRNFAFPADNELRSMYDYALIYVEEDLSQYGKFYLGVPSDEFMDSRTSITVSGFPGGTQSNPSAFNQALYKSDGIVLNINSYNPNIFSNQIMTNAYTSGGNSGGPIYMNAGPEEDEFRTVIGIHTSGGFSYDDNGDLCKREYGTRVTPTLLRFYYDNEYVGN